MSMFYFLFVHDQSYFVIFYNLIGCTSERLFTISWPAGQKSYFFETNQGVELIVELE